MKVRLTHLDGRLPNLALMKLAHWHRARGDEVWFNRTPHPDFWEPRYDRVYGSAIFSWSGPVVRRLQEAFPDAIVGGTGAGDNVTVEETLGVARYEHYDYSIYPDYLWSLGFTQRGCRLNCPFCVVPKKEGKPQALNSIWEIWRPDTPRCLHLLDNDFFGQPEEQWRARVAELQEGNFKVCFNQGINIRMVDEETARVLAGLRYYDDQFQTRRLYTAWDNLGQEKVFFKGLDCLLQAGVRPRHVMVYMLVGYRPGETMEEVMYRFTRIKEAGALPYPMVYNNANKALRLFQRWVIRRYYLVVPWEEFRHSPPPVPEPAQAKLAI